ncbi:MAG: AMP-binding protein, partial [Chloroflexota bacterium]|nr:AMP-binding protein [Chloroflexota bacterium]
MPDWLGQRAFLTPDRLAIVTPRESLTFTELDCRVAQVAGGLASLDVSAGDRVALLGRNSLDFATVVHAVPRLGAILVPLNTRLTMPELAHQVADSQPKLLLVGEEMVSTANALEQVGLQCIDMSRLPMGDTVPPGQIDLAHVHSIIYTSGTTGTPKGAMLTYANFWWSATGSALNLGNRLDDVWLACLPLFHVGGLSILLRSVVYGIPAVIHAGFDPVAVNQAIDHEGVTIISVVSAMLQRMLAERKGRPYPPSLRCVLLGGGPAPLPLLEACASSDVPVVQT